MFVLSEDNTPNSAGSSKTIVSYLTKKGADVNQVDWKRMTSLHHAALRGNVRAAEELLEIPNCLIDVNKWKMHIYILYLSCNTHFTGCLSGIDGFTPSPVMHIQSQCHGGPLVREGRQH
jgi:ankyrin repeat protein